MMIKRWCKNSGFFPRRSCRGMTLVEVLTTVLIYSVILAAVCMVLVSGSTSWQVNSTKVELQQGLRRGMEWMTKDLRQAGTSSQSIINVPGNGAVFNTITFRTANGISGGVVAWSSDTIQYVLGGTGNRDLLRITGSESRVIARNIRTLQIQRLAATANVVDVSLQAEKKAVSGQTIRLDLVFRIALRN